MRPIISIAAFCIVTFAITGKADDEVQLKPKIYEPRKAFSSDSHRTTKYQPDSSRSFISKQAEPQRGRWWQIFRSKKPTPVSTPLSGAKTAQSVPLRQDRQISAATLKAVPKSVTEKKPYNSGVSQTVKPYTPDNRPKPKNPLLRPRQNIKEPQ